MGILSKEVRPFLINSISRVLRSTKSKSSSKSSHKRSHEGHKSSERDKAVPGSSTAQRGFSFLFVVNNLVLSESPSSLSAATADRWGNIMPPGRKCDFEGEVTSPVFRWQDGQVTSLPSEFYGWSRSNGWGTTGGIWGWTFDPSTNSVVQRYMQPYDTYTVFRGWRFLPIMFMGNDATTTNVDEADCEAMYHALSFGSQHGSCVSIAGPNGRLYAAGKDSNWVGRLVPDSYRNPHSDVQTCSGLAGSLPLVLGLMGLSQADGRAADAFTQGLWRDTVWHGPRWTFQGNPLSPGPDDLPRGVVIHVCCDEFDNGTGSTVDMIRSFETNGVISHWAGGSYLQWRINVSGTGQDTDGWCHGIMDNIQGECGGFGNPSSLYSCNTKYPATVDWVSDSAATVPGAGKYFYGIDMHFTMHWPWAESDANHACVRTAVLKSSCYHAGVQAGNCQWFRAVNYYNASEVE